MKKYTLLPLLIMALAIDVFAYSFVGEGKPGPVYDRGLNWLLDKGVDIKIKDINFEPDSEYREIFFKVSELNILNNASSINLILLKGEDIIAIIKRFDLSYERSFSVNISKDALVVILIEVDMENDYLDIGTYRVTVHDLEKEGGQYEPLQ